MFQNIYLWIKFSLKNPVSGPDTEVILKKKRNLRLQWFPDFTQEMPGDLEYSEPIAGNTSL